MSNVLGIMDHHPYTNPAWGGQCLFLFTLRKVQNGIDAVKVSRGLLSKISMTVLSNRFIALNIKFTLSKGP